MVQPRIDMRQLVALLFLSRVFSVLTLSPKQENTVENGAALLGIALSGIVCLILVLLYQKLLSLYPGDNILDCCYRMHPLFGKFCALGFYLLCVSITISTVGEFQYFLSSAIYPYVSRLLLIPLFLLAVLYSAYMGLEAFSRLSLALGVVVLLSTLLVIVSLSKDLSFVFLLPPLRHGWKPVLQVAFQGVSLNLELVPFLLLVPMVRGKVYRGGIWFVALSVGYYLIMIFYSSLTMGDYALSQVFPIYTMMASAQVVLIQRLDSLHMALWVFIAFIKCSLYLYLSAYCASRLFQGKHRGKLLGASVVAVLAGSLWVSGDLAALMWLHEAFVDGIPFLLAGVGIPVVLLLFLSHKKKKEAPGL